MEDAAGVAVAFLLTNFTVTFFVIGGVVALGVIVVRRRSGHEAWRTLLDWFLFFAIGVTYAFNGVMHIAFGDMAAASIGWENNGFQAEVGFASIGVAFVGLLAFPRRMPLSLKAAALVGPACFLWGAAATHIVDIVTTGNLAPNNAGLILYTDILIPLLGFALWGLVVGTRTRPGVRRASSAAADPARA